MTTLGEILEQLQDRGQVYQMLAESGDILLISRLDRVAEGGGDDPCDIALRAVQEFTARADDEAWVKLIGRLQDSQSPAGACLSEMIAWSMKH